MLSSDVMSDGTYSICPGCSLRLPASPEGANPRAGSSRECQRLCDELAFYTLSRGDIFFIHQVLVDAYAAQHATASSKAITVAFALIGLFLFLERGYTGKEVQREHVRLARLSKEWPAFTLPSSRGDWTVADVLQAPSGEKRDAALKQWAASVWATWSKEHAKVIALLKRFPERN